MREVLGVNDDDEHGPVDSHSGVLMLLTLWICTFGTGLEQPAAFGELSMPESAIAFVTSRLGIEDSQVIYKSGVTAETAKVAYVTQAHDGVPFINAVANVGWKVNKVVSFGSSFVKTGRPFSIVSSSHIHRANTDNIASSEPSLPVEEAIPTAEELLDGKYNGHPASIEYLVRPDSSVALVHVIQVQNDSSGTWYEAFVDAHSGEVLSVTDFVADAAYKALPIQKQSLPEGQEVLFNPQDTCSSPLGWHNDGTGESNTTRGNNVIAFKGSLANVTYQSADCQVFNYTYDDTKPPTVGQNIDAARTNAFYIINSVHDFAYRYGFTETAFNFQIDNFGKGGKDIDPVLMSVQDSSGLNNANFATPPDGQWGICRMYIWTLTRVRRDGSLENDIIVHEMTHGITNRMTGGGSARCLQTTEARGMGEGWSDAMAEWTEQTSAIVKDYQLGQTINPLRYSSIAKLNEVHNIGEVWANMLHNVYAALVEQYGFSATARTNPEGTEGNIVFLHLFIDALALQPCQPTSRDAWLQADVNRYGGANSCLLWKPTTNAGCLSNFCMRNLFNRRGRANQTTNNADTEAQGYAGRNWNGDNKNYHHDMCMGADWVPEKPPSLSEPPEYDDYKSPALDAEVVKTIEMKLDELDPELRQLSLKLHGRPEVAFEENYAHDVLSDFMEKHGFKVTRHYAGLKTAWRAEYSIGRGGRVIGINSEMDALPSIGHACGHNLIAICGLGTAVAVKTALVAHGISGKVLILGTPGGYMDQFTYPSSNSFPAEESVGGKIILLEKGAYKEMDFCLMAHPSPGEENSSSDGPTIAAHTMYIEYTGKAEGINALDAAVSAYTAISALRQQMKPDLRVHGIIEGSNWTANMTTAIPDNSKLTYICRAPNKADLSVLVERVQRCLRAAALATGCTVDIKETPAYFDLRQNRALAREYGYNIAARCDMTLNHIGSSASTDFGNVSYEIPSLHPAYAIPTEPNGGNHTPAFTHAARTQGAHNATIKVAKGLALTGFRVLSESLFFDQGLHIKGTNAQVKASFEADKELRRIEGAM
ncbi:hypothetical protein DXG01_010357 [Tephrocybe rancida]|nr:hypothetical protein DXG01_010357 [Tephrocybe rancida]